MNASPEPIPTNVHRVGLGGTTDRSTAHTKTEPKLSNTAPAELKLNEILSIIISAADARYNRKISPV